ncbi:MAG: GntR family transcriptional regulator [Hyphomicrobiaceae bacterium]|jgi:GntR family transcriptional regulator|nr:GntR family transcriptional regulator [Hyphomicrobiaceae bacterium]
MNKANRFETRPLYLQVRDMLLGRITTGNWKPGTLIPNEIDLAREFGLSVGTVRKALDQLQAEHLLTRRQGRGTFVNDLASTEHASRFANLYSGDGTRMTLQSKLVGVSAHAADDAARRVLGLAQGASVIHLVRLKSRKGEPYVYEKSTLPAALFAGLPDDEDIPDEISALAQKYGQIAGSAEETISISKADKDEAEKLSVPESSALLRLERKVYAVEGAILEWRRAVCNLQDGFYKCLVA